jgi:hypothetical protein
VLLVLLQLECQAFAPAISRSVIRRGSFHLRLAWFCILVGAAFTVAEWGCFYCLGEKVGVLLPLFCNVRVGQSLRGQLMLSW